MRGGQSLSVWSHTVTTSDLIVSWSSYLKNMSHHPSCRTFSSPTHSKRMTSRVWILGGAVSGDETW